VEAGISKPIHPEELTELPGRYANGASSPVEVETLCTRLPDPLTGARYLPVLEHRQTSNWQARSPVQLTHSWSTTLNRELLT